MSSNHLLSQYIDCQIPDSKLLIQAKPGCRVYHSDGTDILFNLDTQEHNFSAGGQITIELSLSDEQLLTLQKTIKKYLNKRETIEEVFYYEEN